MGGPVCLRMRVRSCQSTELFHEFFMPRVAPLWRYGLDVPYRCMTPALDNEAGLHVDAFLDRRRINDAEVDVPRFKTLRGLVQRVDGGGSGIVCCPFGPFEERGMTLGDVDQEPITGLINRTALKTMSGGVAVRREP